MRNSLAKEEINAFDFELEEFISHMKRQVLEVLWPFISFMHVIDKKKGHNMLALMLDPRYKSMHLMTSYLGREATANLVVDYDEKVLLPSLLEAYKV